MQQSPSLSELVEHRLRMVLDAKRTTLAALSPDAEPLSAHLDAMLAGGKRLRSRFALAGWQACSDGENAPAALIELGVALELFHAAALVHDDLIDRSATRRGLPAAHTAFAALHRAETWAGDADHFGMAAAVLLGDLLLVWSAELSERAVREAGPAAGAAVADLLTTMREEVTVGQYLDVLAEQEGGRRSPAEQLERALLIARVKSGRYSVAYPIRIGAALAGADARRMSALAEAGEWTGLAFQLRDDLLGALGDSAITGKPSGDDIREGKRTVLVAEALQLMSDPDAMELAAALGNQDVDADTLTRVQHALLTSGAVAAVEARIAEAEGAAFAALDDSGASQAQLAPLRGLIAAATRRHA